MTELCDQTQMFKEAGEAHLRVKSQLAHNQVILRDLAGQLKSRSPHFVMICARGSSAHAGVYARYLIETRLKIPVVTVAPSISSIFHVHQNLSNAVFIAISQSGQSPDSLTAAQAAKDGGAFIISLVNNEASPLAQLSDMVIPLRAGEEKSVAATKTFICTLTAIAQLIALWSENEKLLKGLGALPAKLKQAFEIRWETALTELQHTQSLFVISRGLGLGISNEAALKFKETCGLHAESYSAAEVKHGPMALVKSGFPVLIFSTGDENQASIDDVSKLFSDRNAKIFRIGSVFPGASSLAQIDSNITELRPIVAIQTFYRFVNKLSIARGMNPDSPEFLNKVTKTL